MRIRTMAARLVVAVVLAPATLVSAQDVTRREPAAVLVMPFDATEGRASFALVSRIGASFGGAPIDTHWVFYADDCRHLANVIIALTDRDSIVVDPTRVQGEVQTLNPPVNHPTGPAIDLSGERGLVIVSARRPGGGVSPQLVGSWTIADLGAQAAYGSDAIGLRDGMLPDPSPLAAGVVIQTFRPETLDDSLVIVFGLEGEGEGVTPILQPSPRLGGAHVCCNVAFTDTLEFTISLPDFCFPCAGFAAIAAGIGAPSLSTIAPPTATLASAGFLRLASCRTASDLGVAPLGEGQVPQYLFAFHGQAIGPFGVTVAAKYTGANGLIPR